MSTESPAPSSGESPGPRLAPEGAVVSPDGKSWWDGQRWVPIEPAADELLEPSAATSSGRPRRAVLIGAVALLLVLAAALLVSRMLAGGNPLTAAVEECEAGLLGDNDRTLILDMEGEESFSGSMSYGEVTCVLEAVDTPDAVWDKMGRTTSLQGVQSDSWNGIEASWTYHPDQGLDIILELEN